MRAHRRIRILLLLLTALTPANSAELRIESDFSIVSGGNGDWMGRLTAGSVVKIPDNQVIRDSKGRPDVELTLKQWTSRLYLFDKFGSVVYYPVEVVSAAKGSSPTIKPGTVGVVALSTLARRNGFESMELTVTRTTQLGKVPPKDAPTKSFAEIQEGARKKVKQKPSSFVTTHCPTSTADVASKVEASAMRIGMPAEILKSIALIESDGDCSVHGDLHLEKARNGISVGLFQVLTTVADHADCKPSSIKLSIPQQEARRNRCVAHVAQPDINIAIAERLVQQKIAALKKVIPDLDRHPEFKWRLLVSSYNGGQRWIFKAIERAKEENAARVRKSKPPLYDVYNYVDLVKVMLLPRRDKNDRLPGLAAMNVGYVDAVFGLAKKLKGGLNVRGAGDADFEADAQKAR